MRRFGTPLRFLLLGVLVGWLVVPPIARAVESAFVTIVGPSGNQADVSAGRRLLVDTGESQPFQKTRGATVSGEGQPSVRYSRTFSFLDVPSGKMVELEHVSARIEFESCHEPSVSDIDVRLVTRLVNDNAVTTFVPMEPAYAVPGDSDVHSEPAAYVGDRAITAYAGPGTSITVSMVLTKLEEAGNCTQARQAFLSATVSGHLVDTVKG